MGAKLRNDGGRTEKEIQDEFAQTTRHWSKLMAAIYGLRKTKVVRLGQPEGRKFYHPVDKRLSKENVDAMRSAEENLDNFWAAVDQDMCDRYGTQLEGTALFHLLSQSSILVRTAPWAEPT